MSKRSRTIVLAGLGLALALAVPGVARAQTGIFPQVASAALVRVASGLIHDVTVLDAPPHWTLNGQWTLSCRPTFCVDTLLEDILFDLSLVMVRPDGTSSHVHSFSSFVAEVVTLSPDQQNLTIEGTIVGSGAVGPADIIINLTNVGSDSSYTIELPANGHLFDTLSGLILVSR